MISFGSQHKAISRPTSIAGVSPCDKHTYTHTHTRHVCAHAHRQTHPRMHSSQFVLGSPSPHQPARYRHSHVLTATEHHPHSACASLISGTTADGYRFKQAQRKKRRQSWGFSRRVMAGREEGGDGGGGGGLVIPHHQGGFSQLSQVHRDTHGVRIFSEIIIIIIPHT